jgi:hypothetical protein
MTRSSCNPSHLRLARVPPVPRIWGPGITALALAIILAPALHSQAVTVDSSGRIKDGSSAATDRRFAQIEPTHVALDNSTLDPKTRLELIRVLQAEQGFAMRPIPRGHKGLTLVANGKVEPSGEGWLNMITEYGLSAKPADRVVITDLKVDHNRIIFDLNGGPDQKHRFLRHIEVGGGVAMTPVVQDDGQEPVGARLTLVFEKQIPELTGTQVKALLAPLISFDVKTPVQAFTDTLPPVLKDAILNHHVLVGMSTEMVLFAVGQPQKKIRETEDQMPFEEWIYGDPPKPVQFVRFNGNRVIRLEIAKVGEPPTIFTKDEVAGLMRTDGSPIMPSNTRTISMGDTTYNPDTQAAPAPPSLKKPGEKLPDDANNGKAPGEGEMGPVQFPKPNPDDDPPVAHHPQQPAQQQPPAQPPATPANQPAPSTPPQQPPASGQPAPTPPPVQQPSTPPQPNRLYPVPSTP